MKSTPPKIASLEGAPEKIAAGDSPTFTSLENAPQKIGAGEIPAMTSLYDGSVPDKISGDFVLHPRFSLPNKITGDFEIFTQLSQAPKEIKGDFVLSPPVSIPEVVIGNFDSSGNSKTTPLQSARESIGEGLKMKISAHRESLSGEKSIKPAAPKKP